MIPHVTPTSEAREGSESRVSRRRLWHAGLFEEVTKGVLRVDARRDRARSQSPSKKPYTRAILYPVNLNLIFRSFYVSLSYGRRAKGDRTPVPVLSEFRLVGDRLGVREWISQTIGSSYGSITRQKARVKKITWQIPSDLPHTVPVQVSRLEKYRSLLAIISNFFNSAIVRHKIVFIRNNLYNIISLSRSLSLNEKLVFLFLIYGIIHGKIDKLKLIISTRELVHRTSDVRYRERRGA